MKREVKEETGVEFEPEALIAVELGSHKWVRFTLTGELRECERIQEMRK